METHSRADRRDLSQRLRIDLLMNQNLALQDERLEKRKAAVEDWLQNQVGHPVLWLAFFALLIAVQISPFWYPTPDATAYLSIARSIASGNGLRNFGYAHVPYPPGYPIIISPA